jgi:hypothetical protein
MVVDGRTVVNGKSTQILSQKGSIVIKLCHPSVPHRFHLQFLLFFFLTKSLFGPSNP